MWDIKSSSASYFRDFSNFHLNHVGYKDEVPDDWGEKELPFI